MFNLYTFENVFSLQKNYIYFWQLSPQHEILQIQVAYKKAVDHEDYYNFIKIFMADYHKIIICREDYY